MRGDSKKLKLTNAIDYAVAPSRNKKQFIEQMKKLGYGVNWIERYKYITYSTPDGQRFRDNRLLDDKYLKTNMEELFAYGYPNRDNSLRIAVKTRPSQIVRIVGTFSKMKYAGCFAASIRESSKKRVPRGSSKALLAPAALKATHGKPPTRRSKSGISSVLTALASLQKYSPFVGYKVR